MDASTVKETGKRWRRVRKGQTQACKYYGRAGGCKYGEDCIYVHDRALWEEQHGGRTFAPSEDELLAEIRELPSEEVDAAWAVGHAVSCSLDHIPQPEADVPDDKADSSSVEQQQRWSSTKDLTRALEEEFSLEEDMTVRELCDALRRKHPEWLISRSSVLRAANRANLSKPILRPRSWSARLDPPRKPDATFRSKKSWFDAIKSEDDGKVLRLKCGGHFHAETCTNCGANNYDELWERWVPTEGAGCYRTCCGIMVEFKDGYI